LTTGPEEHVIERFRQPRVRIIRRTPAGQANGSVNGTARCRTIHSPIARCSGKSGSESWIVVPAISNARAMSSTIQVGTRSRSRCGTFTRLTCHTPTWGATASRNGGAHGKKSLARSWRTPDIGAPAGDAVGPSDLFSRPTSYLRISWARKCRLSPAPTARR